MSRFLKTLGYIAAPKYAWITIGVLWIGLIVLINPHGNFPLNDDWAYAKSVWHLVETGQLKMENWPAMTLVAQIYWGALFSWIFGLSFDSLRISTLVSSYVGIYLLFLLVHQMSQSKKLAWFCILILLFNPMYFCLSFTFMTDVYFATFTAITLLFFIRFLQNGKWIDWSLGITFSLVAILCRQFGLFLPMAFCVVFLFVNLKIFTHKKISLRIISQAVLPLVLGLTALFFFQNWMENTGRTPFAYGAQTGRLWSLLQDPMELPVRFFKNTFIALIYLGWFLLPLCIRWWTVDKKRLTVDGGRWTVLFSVIVFFGLFYFDKAMPLGKNIIQKTGIGPLSLYDTMILDLQVMESIGVWFWWAVTGVGVFGGVLYIYLITNIFIKILIRIKKRNLNVETSIALFFLLGACIYFLPIALHGFFDRYLLPLLIILPLAIFIFYDKKNTNKTHSNSKSIAYLGMYIIAALLAVQIAFSVIVTHDYLSWNRTRWRAIHDLNEVENIPLVDIDGGLEFNGLHFYDAQYQAKDTTGVWWWTGERDYVLSFSELSDFELIKKYKYRQFISRTQGEILILKRK